MVMHYVLVLYKIGQNIIFMFVPLTTRLKIDLKVFEIFRFFFKVYYVDILKTTPHKTFKKMSR